MSEYGASFDRLARRWAVIENEHDREHPPIPAAALPVLPAALDCTNGEPLRWWHHRTDPWGAVTTLHRQRDHASAAALAEVLTWCETHGSQADHTLWEIVPAKPTT